jgi:hypothetical protein
MMCESYRICECGEIVYFGKQKTSEMDTQTKILQKNYESTDNSREHELDEKVLNCTKCGKRIPLC